MREIFCLKCGTLVMKIEAGQIKKGTVCTCQKCHKKEHDIPDFFRGFHRK